MTTNYADLYSTFGVGTPSPVITEESPTAIFPDNVDECHLQMSSMDAELAETKQALSEALTRVVYLESDINLIGEHMDETATDHDYCSVYDNAVDWLNGRMRGGVMLPSRTTEEQYEYVVTVTVQGIRRDETAYSDVENALSSSGVDEALSSYLSNSDTSFDHIEVTAVRSY